MSLRISRGCLSLLTLVFAGVMMTGVAVADMVEAVVVMAEEEVDMVEEVVVERRDLFLTSHPSPPSLATFPTTLSKAMLTPFSRTCKSAL